MASTTALSLLAASTDNLTGFPILRNSSQTETTEDLTSSSWDIIRNVELHLVGQALTSFFLDILISISVAFTDFWS